MNVEISYNGEPITLRTVKNGFNACRRQQYCIKVRCKSPARSKTLITSVSLELLGEIAGLARGVQGLRGKEGPLAAGSSLWRALKAMCVKALAKCALDCQAAPAPSPGVQPSRKGGTKEGMAIASAYGSGWKGANLLELKTQGFQVVKASQLEASGLPPEDRAALARFVTRNMIGSLPGSLRGQPYFVHEPEGQEILCAAVVHIALQPSTSTAQPATCAPVVRCADLSRSCP